METSPTRSSNSRQRDGESTSILARRHRVNQKDNAPVIVTRERSGTVGLVTLNRPDVRNAIDAEMTSLLEAAFDDLEGDNAIRALVITGAGNMAFSAGMDLRAFAKTGTRGMVTKKGGYAGMVRRKFTRPLVAAVNGLAYGGGLELVLACDLVVASNEAKFALPESKVGVIAGGGGLVRLPRRLPLGVALYMAITGMPITADEARTYGLVNRVCAAEDVLASSLDIAATVARNAPLSVALSRQVILASIDGTEEEAWTANFEALGQIFNSLDAREGAAAFVERREPVWTGR